MNCQGAYTSGCTPWLGHTDWRLPTSVELSGTEDNVYATGGIVDFTAPACTGGAPCINAIFGPTGSDIYWSSSTNLNNPASAWGLSFGNGYNYGAGKTDVRYVRAVRGGS